MNLKVEHGIIAILLLAFLYYFFTHQSLLSDLSIVPDKGNPELKAVKGKHDWKDVGEFVGINKSGLQAVNGFGDAMNYFGVGGARVARGLS
jgi:hypothetical protein